MSLEDDKKLIRKELSNLKINFNKAKSYYQKRLEELEMKLSLIKRKQKLDTMLKSNKRNKSEILGINTHSSIETSISKMRGRKPINLQAAKAIGLPTKKKY